MLHDVMNGYTSARSVVCMVTYAVYSASRADGNSHRQFLEYNPTKASGVRVLAMRTMYTIKYLPVWTLIRYEVRR